MVAIVVSFTSVSRDDYRKAYNQMSELSSANTSLNTEVSTLQYSVSSATETKFNNDIKAAEEALEKVRSENEELSEMKAVKVGEGKKKYDEFNEKFDKYLTYIDEYLKSFKDLYTASKPCDADVDTSDVTAYKSALNECKSALDKVNNTPNKDVNTYIKSLSTEYDKLSSVVDKLSTITDPYGKQYDEYKTLRDQVYEVQENITNSYTDFKSNIEKHSKEAGVKDEADDLIELLSEKASL